MQLSEAEREVLTNEANGQLPKPTQWLGWTEALYGLWLQRTRIARWIVFGLVLTIPIAWRYPKYESTAQIMPPDNGNSGGLAGLLPALSKSPGLIGLAGDLAGVKSTGAVSIKVLQSRTVADNLIRDFDLRKTYGIKDWEGTRMKLASRTSIVDDKKSGVISITVRDRDPELARKLTDAYIKELNNVTASVSTSAAGREREFIQKRLQEETKSLQDAEQQFSQFASANMALDVPQQTRVMVEAAARLQGEMIATRAQLEGLKETYTSENIRVKSAQAHLNELEHELGKINTGRTADQDPNNPYPSVKSLPVLGVKWADLYRSTKIRETVVELLTQQFEMARIQEAKDIGTAKVLDEASTPEHKRPAWTLIMLIGGLLSLVLACLGYLIKGWWDRWDRDDPRRMLLAQVLSSGQGIRNPIRRIFQRSSVQPEQMSQQ